MSMLSQIYNTENLAAETQCTEATSKADIEYFVQSLPVMLILGHGLKAKFCGLAISWRWP